MKSLVPWPLLTAALLLASAAHAAPTNAPAPPTAATVLTVAGDVRIFRHQTTNGEPARANSVLGFGDQIRTEARARATIRLTDRSLLQIPERTIVVIEPPAQKAKGILRLNSGKLYLNNREQPDEVILNTPLVGCAVRGTELVLSVEPSDGSTTLQMLDGEVQLSNELGQLTLRTGEQATVVPRRPPERTAAVGVLTDWIQWCLYYPAVIVLEDLGLPDDVEQSLADSIEAYRAGDLLEALRSYPARREPGEDQERVYLAGLLLAVGQVTDCERYLQAAKSEDPAVQRLAAALRELLAVVRNRPPAGEMAPETATEYLAPSYRRQSRGELPAARDAAREATRLAPVSGFAWARLAELEFCFGREQPAQEALERALLLSPRHAPAVALRGFVLAARNQVAAAEREFGRAIEIDGALGNAWLGRGLCRIRRGDERGGLLDLHMAVALEPQQSVFRSYLGKAFSEAKDDRHAVDEVNLARRLDPNDPTSWLYSALLLQRRNRINEAIHDLEKSQELNDRRMIYRSALLLDQDRAVRSASLAGIYQDAGMAEVSRREAIRAVMADYANYSAHQFLADSYNVLRDPRLVNLRYETPAFAEYLIANLLAPVQAGHLSQYVRQNEYSHLFERDGLGVSSKTEYYNNGDWVQYGSQYGSGWNAAYALEALYRWENGQRVNQDLEQVGLSLKTKFQITPQDDLFFMASYFRHESGDVRPHYDEETIHRTLRVVEEQEPFLVGGYHRRWNEANHTLLLVGATRSTFEVRDDENLVLVFGRDRSGAIDQVPLRFPTAPLTNLSTFAVQGFELQHLYQSAHHQLVIGGRFQGGGIDTTDHLGQSRPVEVVIPGVGAFPISTPASSLSVASDLTRWGIYAYDQVRLDEVLTVIAGLSYEGVEYPVNFVSSPISAGKDVQDQVSPKVGFIWEPFSGSVLRGAYGRSLGGATFEQSFRIEPVQVAGFNQAYRNLIPEAEAGFVAGAEMETYGLAWDQRLPSRTYLGVEGSLLRSEAERELGSFQVTLNPFWFGPASIRQELEFEEAALVVSANQLLGRHWSLGAAYRISEDQLHSRFPEISTILTTGADTTHESTLHQVRLDAHFNHSSGAFADLFGTWYSQSNRGYTPDRPGDDFWMLDVYAGFRWARRSAELKIGLLNLLDEDYRLNPLNPYVEPRRERTFLTAFKWYF